MSGTRGRFFCPIILVGKVGQENRPLVPRLQPLQIRGAVPGRDRAGARGAGVPERGVEAGVEAGQED